MFPVEHWAGILQKGAVMTDFEEGFLLGILVGEGHFGGHGNSALVSVRMHVRQAELFHWLAMHVPGSRLYGPYHHGGRHCFVWVVRSTALREEMVPFLKRHLDKVDSHIRERITNMFNKYRL